METFVYLLILDLVVILSPIPLPTSCPTTLRPNITRVLSPSSRPLGGRLPPSERGRKTYDWRAAAPMRQHRFCLSPCSSLPNHGLPRSHTWSRTLTTPLHTTTLHSHLLPPTSLHLIAISILAIKLPVRHVPLGLASVAAKDRATLHTHHSS